MINEYEDYIFELVLDYHCQINDSKFKTLSEYEELFIENIALGLMVGNRLKNIEDFLSLSDLYSD